MGSESPPRARASKRDRDDEFKDKESKSRRREEREAAHGNRDEPGERRDRDRDAADEKRSSRRAHDEEENREKSHRRDKEKEHERERDRDRDRDREKERDRGKDRDRDRDKDRDRSDRDREAGGPIKAEEAGEAGEKLRDNGREKEHLPPPPSLKEEPEEEKKLPPPPARAEPLSLEEILMRKKQQAMDEAKPRFISKKEREAMALQKREQEVAAQRGGNSALGSAAALLSRGGSSAVATYGNLAAPAPSMHAEPPGSRDDERDIERRGERSDVRERYGRDARDHRDRDTHRSREWDRDRDRGRDRDNRDRDNGRDRDRDNGKDRDRGRGGRDTAQGAGPASERDRARELEMIKQQYLGADKKKKKTMKPSDKFRFNFDWEATEDTSKDLNPLYNSTHEAALMFGRGMRAGIDRREQKKTLVTLEREMLRKNRLAAGIEETTETRKQEREREKMANQYDGFDMRVEKHWTEKSLEDMTERDWRIFREDFNISYKGNANVLPIRNWGEAKIPKELMQAIERVGYTKPSPIQMAAIPLGLAGRDVIGIAETGSGKTCAFMVPLLAYIMKQPPMTEERYADGPYSVIMAPTRELAQQIEEEAIKLAHYTSFKTIAIVGGQSIEEQGAKLRRGCEIVVATPGRLIDCIERSYAVLNQCNYVVMDEADRMIDLGFEPQINGVLDAMPSSNLKPEGDDEDSVVLEADRVYRTTYMFSATMPPLVERLARKYLRRPCVVNIGRAGKTTENVTQRVIMLKENEKHVRLQQEMEVLEEKRAIVFVNTKRQSDNVYNQLESNGFRCTVLHGGKSQDQREASIKGFREDQYNILIATDVAGRGIDVPGIALVINYDMPSTVEAYTHRIGRTGRAGKKGIAITFLTMSDTEVYYDLKKLLEESKAVVPPELARHEAAKTKPGGHEKKRDAIQYAKK